MSLRFARFSDLVFFALCLAACLGSYGCHGLISGGLSALPLPPSSQPGSAVVSAATQRVPGGQDARAPSATATQADFAADRAVLARSIETDPHGRSLSVWIRAAEPSQAPWRWRYPNLEELLARPAHQRPDFSRFLADEDRVVAINAAIALARCGDGSGRQRLATAAGAPEIPLPMRCAAVEAMAALPGAATVGSLRELIDQYGREQRNGTSRYIADLHAELIRGLGRHLDAADDPRFVEALRSPAADVRLEALTAWSAGRRSGLPIEAVDLRSDGDWRVRAAALQALAKRRHPQAHEYANTALRDNDMRVRIAAVAALGELGSDDARATLAGLIQKNQPERIRAESVAALTRLGAKQPVLDAAGDPSWRVRLKVAEALAAWPDRDGIAAARRLLDDPSSEVERAVIAALAPWPLEQAGPLLLLAMGKDGLMARKSAVAQLVARWPAAADFPPEGSPERRAEVLEHLESQLRQQFCLIDQAALAEAASGGGSARPVTPAQLVQIEQLVERQDVQGLLKFGPGLVESLEQLVCDRGQPLPELIYRDVLPRCGPVFVALSELGSPDLSQRRHAADRLAELAKQQPLGRLAVTRLVELVAAEPDQLVWRSVLLAVAGDPSEPSIRLAYAAIGHASPEVRRRACEHLAAHPHPQHAAVLLPALQDASHSVVCAAIRALGATGRLDDTEPLRRLSGSTNEQVQLEAGVALVRLGDACGPAALERLAYSNDPIIQRRAAEAMGEVADPSLTPTLIRLLDGQAGVCRAALESLPKTVGRDVAQDDGPPAENTSERIRRWKQWYERHN